MGAGGCPGHATTAPKGGLQDRVAGLATPATAMCVSLSVAVFVAYRRIRFRIPYCILFVGTGFGTKSAQSPTDQVMLDA
jgi:hypothetical protein